MTMSGLEVDPVGRHGEFGVNVLPADPPLLPGQFGEGYRSTAELVARRDAKLAAQLADAARKIEQLRSGAVVDLD